MPCALCCKHFEQRRQRGTTYVITRCVSLSQQGSVLAASHIEYSELKIGGSLGTLSFSLVCFVACVEHRW